MTLLTRRVCKVLVISPLFQSISVYFRLFIVPSYQVIPSSTNFHLLRILGLFTYKSRLTTV